MSTNIEWTATVHPDGTVTKGETWNPVTGCSKVSPGCAHCYAEGVALRFWPTQYPPVAVEVPIGDCTVKGDANIVHRPRQFTDVMCHEDRLDQPLRWKKPRKVFVNSMSDLFHEDVPDAFIDRVFAVMALAPRHTFQVLTKRVERMRTYLTDETLTLRDGTLCAGVGERIAKAMYEIDKNAGDVAWPLPNVWLGVSVENQRFADERIPLLLRTPAAIRFISAEPLLGPIVLRDHFIGEKSARDGTGPPLDWARPWLDWVIVGGESGRNARPCDLAWVRSIVQQCHAAGVPAFVKQLGANPTAGMLTSRELIEGGKGRPRPADQPLSEDAASAILADVTVSAFRRQLGLRDKKGGDPAEWPEDLRVRDFPEARR